MPLIEAFPGPSGVVDSTELRRDLAGLLTLNADGSPRAGVFYGSASAIGVARAGDMRIDLRSFDAALVRNGGPLFTRNEGTDQSPVLPVPSSNQIIHVVYARQNEKDSPYGDANNTPGFGFVSSTQSASPQLADALALLPAGALPLVSVQVPSTATTTSSANVVVKDIAPFTAMNGGVVPFRSQADVYAWTNPLTGQLARVIGGETYIAASGWQLDHPFAEAAGYTDALSTTLSPGAIANAVVNFPNGRFTQPPIPLVTGTGGRFTVVVIAVSATQMTIQAQNNAQNNGVPGRIFWTAKQMLGASAAG